MGRTWTVGSPRLVQYLRTTVRYPTKDKYVDSEDRHSEVREIFRCRENWKFGVRFRVKRDLQGGLKWSELRERNTRSGVS